MNKITYILTLTSIFGLVTVAKADPQRGVSGNSTIIYTAPPLGNTNVNTVHPTYPYPYQQQRGNNNTTVNVIVNPTFPNNNNYQNRTPQQQNRGSTMYSPSNKYTNY